MGKCRKLDPRFCGPFEILPKKGLLAYELALSSHVKVHNVFHTLLLKKNVYDTKHVIDWSLLQVGLEREFLSEPLHILDKREAQLSK